MPTSPRFAPRRLRLRRTALVGAVLFAALVLSGCVTVQLKATVHSDNTVSGTVRTGILKTLASVAGGSSGDALKQLRSGNDCDFGGKAGSIKDFDDGTYIGVDCAFSGVTLEQFNAGTDGPKLTRSGDTFQLAGRMNVLQTLGNSAGGGQQSSSGSASSAPSSLPSGLPTDLSSLLPSGFPTDLSSLLPSGFPTDLSSLLPSGLPTDLSGTGSGAAGLPGLDPSAMLKTAKISFEFSFPGKVSSSKGQVHGNTVAFSPDASGNVDFQTTASAKPSSGTGIGSAAWIGLAVLLLIVVAALTLLLRRRRARAVAAVGGPPPAFYGQPAQPGAQYPNPQYPAQEYPGQQYPGQEYPNPQYPTQQYPTQQYPTQQYPSQQYPSQQEPYPGPPPTGSSPYGTQPHPAPPDTAPNPWSAPPPTQQLPDPPPVQPNPWGPPAERDQDPPAGEPPA